VRRGALLGIASALAALFVTAAAPPGGDLLRIDSLRLDGLPKARVPARSTVDWCGLTQPTALNRTPDADLSSPRQVHVTYVVPADVADRFWLFASPIATDAAAMDSWWRREDPSRTIRFDRFAFPGCGTKAGQLDLGFVRLPRAGSLYVGDAGIDRLLTDLGALESLSNHKHLVYYDGAPPFEASVCGTAFVPRAATTNGGFAGIAFVWLQSLCGGDVGAGRLNAAVAVHELIHGLGAMQGANPPNECEPPDDGHVCDVSNDVLYPLANSQTTISGQTLDAGRDDYYGHSGSWFDVQDSGWLTHLPQQRLTVGFQATGAAGGVVRLTSPTSFECAQPCTLELDSGLAARLVGTPRSGARLVRWLGACSGKGPCTVTLDAARSVTAVFGPATFRLTVGVGGRGRVSSAPARVSCPGSCAASFKADSSVRLRAAAAAGFRFVSWSGACRGTGACVVKMSANRSVKAIFRKRT
jgi:Divergent InlB B-repeat domain